MKYFPVDVRLFEYNRKKFIEKMLPNSIAVFNSNDEMPRSADGFHHFRQNSDLFYLSGIDQEQSILVLFPDHPIEEYREVLFLRRTNEHVAVWEGHKYTKEEATETSGIKKIFWVNDFNNIFPGMMNLAENCYLNLNEHGRYSNPVPYKDLRFAQEVKQSFPLHNFQRSAPILTDLRRVKHRYEVELVEEAVAITKKGFDRVLHFMRPGVMEFEVEAEITHEFLRNRATGHAYSPIIASGKNACVLHYVDNNQECKDGDLILMDFGAEYANYAADLTRTIPVNGRYNERQKAVYNSVLHLLKEAKKILRPGVLIEEYHKEVGKIAESELKKLGLLTQADIDNQNPNRPAYKKYLMHGISHSLGLDVHDVNHRHKKVEAGMIFTVEPGFYIPAENMGIRIENDILVTDGNPVDLMDQIPMEIEEIEDIMQMTMVN